MIPVRTAQYLGILFQFLGFLDTSLLMNAKLRHHCQHKLEFSKMTQDVQEPASHDTEPYKHDEYEEVSRYLI